MGTQGDEKGDGKSDDELIAQWELGFSDELLCHRSKIIAIGQIVKTIESKRFDIHRFGSSLKF